MNPTVLVRDVVLVGGGHSHALLLKRWAMSPLPGVRLTLISRDVLTPYSGMLPGLVAGHYSYEQAHIDLARLCAWARVRFIEAEMTGLDLEARRVQLQDGRPPIGFDLLSLDTGSTPDLSVPGAREHVIPVKPVHRFHLRWTQWLDMFEASSIAQPRDLAIVGSGAGGYELLMAIRHRLPAAAARLHWILRSDRALGHVPSRASEIALREAVGRGVVIHRNFDVQRVEAGVLHAEDGRRLAVDDTLWVTGAAAPHWVRQAGLDTDARGFVATNAFLQSRSHPYVFATGDIGTQIDTPAPKAGVYAVRQAPRLFHNLRALLLGGKLKRYRPQQEFLALISQGDKRAIAIRNGRVLSGTLMWHWKDYIDRRFMEQFSDLRARPMMRNIGLPDKRLLASHDLFTHGASVQELPSMRCNGCGAKVGQGVLKRVLARLELSALPGSVQGVSDGGDVAAWQQHRQVVVQSVDQLRAMIDDPWRFARIATLHALSDVWAAAAKPRSAQLLVTLPPALPTVLERDLEAVLRGAVHELEVAGCVLVGGHSGEGNELSLGVLVNAELPDGTTFEQQDLQPGDAIVLSKPLGVGVVLAGFANLKASGLEARAAWNLMLQSNAAALRLAQPYGAKPLTDITGFGLVGHVAQVFEQRTQGIRIDVDCLRWLPGAERLAREGVASSLYPANREALTAFEVDPRIEPWQMRLLADPQSGGGLLLAVPAPRAQACVEALQAAGQAAERIGVVLPTPQRVLQLSRFEPS